MLFCGNCGREFATKKGKARHKRKGCSEKEIHEEIMRLPIDARVEVFDAIAGDLPDGAYWAMAEEFGLEPTDFIEG